MGQEQVEEMGQEEQVVEEMGWEEQMEEMGQEQQESGCSLTG